MTGRMGLALTVVLAVGMLVAAPTVSAQPTPISVCGAIPSPGSYVLTQNLVSATADCLVVTADDVTIDLAGFQISCAAGCGGGGVSAGGGGGQNLAVRNGTIRGFGVGINLANADFGFVERVRLVGNTLGLEAGNGTIVKDCIVADNTKGGLRVQRGSVITGNAVAGAKDGGTGIFAITSVVTGNSVRSGTDGIGGGAGVIFGNTVSDATTSGIFTDESVIAHNFADSFQGPAIRGSMVVVTGNNAFNLDKGEGISVTSRSLVTGNRAEGGPGVTANCPALLVENVAMGGISTSGPGCRRSDNIPAP